MYTIVKTDDGKIIISENLYNAPSPSSVPTPSPSFAPTPSSSCNYVSFNDIGDDYIVSFSSITDIKSFNTLIDISKGEIQSRYLGRYYRFSLNDVDFTEWLPITETNFDGFPCLDGDTVSLEIKWTREGKNRNGDICLQSYVVNGEWERRTAVAADFILGADNEVIVKPTDVYKVFKLTNFELISNASNIQDLNIQFRFSQDSGKHWSQWEYLTKSNISTINVNPTRFFYIEYKFTNTTPSSINVYDLNLLGDFQNVTKDYYKTNLFGIRQDGCCISCLFGGGDTSTGTDPYNGILSSPYNIVDLSSTNQFNSLGKGADCALPDVLLNPLDEAAITALYNPYDLTKATQLVDSLSNSTTQIFGHEVLYFLTSPDKLGIDTSFNEYQLFNVDCHKEIKVMVEENNFPDNQIKFNEFDLALFDQFEIHITKKMFKEAFGVESRPAQQDFLYFCALNRMYQVSHAQPFKDFNNGAIYYKVMLTKYNQKANVQASDSTIEQRIAELTKNSTIDELLGKELSNEEKSIANKDQFVPLTRDVVRLDVISKIEKELVENASLVLSKYHYNMSTSVYNTPAVTYKNGDNILNDSDNRSYSAWFKLNNYSINETFNFMSNYDSSINVGYKINLLNDEFVVTLNGIDYVMPYASLTDDIWYCYTVNIDQRQRKVQQYLYKRNSATEVLAKTLRSSELLMLTSNELDMIPTEFELEDITMQILTSDMRITNIRVYNDVVPLDKHTIVLNQNIIRDSDFLVLADNANKKLYLPKFDQNREA
jgi:hypothetical protein